MTFQAQAFAVRVVADLATGVELSRGLVEVLEVHSDGSIVTISPPERFREGVNGQIVRVATSRRTAADLNRIVTLEADPGARSWADAGELEHVSGPLGRVISEIPRPGAE